MESHQLGFLLFVSLAYKSRGQVLEFFQEKNTCSSFVPGGCMEKPTTNFYLVIAPFKGVIN